MLIQALTLAWTAAVKAPVFDEVSHLPAGISHWKFGRFELYRVNPPLIRMLATVPLLIVEPDIDWSGAPDGPFEKPEVTYGKRFLKANGDDAFRCFTYARWALIPVALLGGWICYCWSNELFGPPCGLIALALWSLCPTVLGWGATITPDVGAATFGVAACYAFWRWLDSPRWGRAFACGVALGLAELAKSTWIILFALWPIIWLAWRICSTRQQPAIPPATQLAFQLILGLYILNAGYGFEGTFQPLGQYRFISQSLSGLARTEFPGNRFSGTLAARIPIPLPVNYVLGIDAQKRDFEDGKSSYLRGEHKLGGWYHYYVYAMAVKTTLGTECLLLMAVCLMLSSVKYRREFSSEIALLLPAVAVLVLVSSQTGFNRYVRYVLPALPFLFIVASRVGRLFERRKILPALSLFCVTATAVESLSVAPHSMSFFNMLAGGPRGGHAHLLDANIDWGQDLLELKRLIDRRPDIATIKLVYFGFVDPKLAGIEFTPLAAGRTREGLVEPGWYAISAHYLYDDTKLNPGHADVSWFRQLKPDAMAGYSIYLFHVSPVD